MKTIQLLAKVLLVFAGSVALAQASDPTAVYARVDKVVLEPNANSPETIQVWGVFSLAKSNDRNAYLPPARGYLYFKLAHYQQETAQRVGGFERSGRHWPDRCVRKPLRSAGPATQGR